MKTTMMVVAVVLVMTGCSASRSVDADAGYAMGDAQSDASEGRCIAERADPDGWTCLVWLNPDGTTTPLDGR